MKTAISILAATLISTPAMAWHSISIWNETDPIEIVKVIYTAPGKPAQVFTLDLPGGPGWFRVFGPLHDDGGPCLRTLSVVVSNPSLGWAIQNAKTPMNVCTESSILVSGMWPGGGYAAGTSPLVVTHK